MQENPPLIHVSVCELRICRSPIYLFFFVLIPMMVNSPFPIILPCFKQSMDDLLSREFHRCPRQANHGTAVMLWGIESSAARILEETHRNTKHPNQNNKNPENIGNTDDKYSSKNKPLKSDPNMKRSTTKPGFLEGCLEREGRDWKNPKHVEISKSARTKDIGTTKIGSWLFCSFILQRWA